MVIYHSMKNAELRRKVERAYSDAAENPQDEHAFPVGRAFAEGVGYSREVLSGLPATAVDTFAGVSNVSMFASIPEGAAVLDLGCGAGLDSLIAARRATNSGRVLGIDFSEAMLRRARQSADETGVDNLLFVRADAERLPLPDKSVEVVMVNGIFNLNLAREMIFRELGRVVRPGGAVYAAELILSAPLAPEQNTDSNWFA